MWPFTRPINLIRYLIVWRVNSSLVWLPNCLVPEISYVLGTLIADRLPTREAGEWHKALAPWGEESIVKKERKTIPEVSWPIESVLLVYPGKRSYGQGELILWELKLMGGSAEHGLFLEVILPAMEEAATTSDSRWHQQNGLWGRFDVHAIYAARGTTWEPFVEDGRLDLSYQATPTQWAEGLTFEVKLRRVLDRLTWVTPFDLSEGQDRPGRARRSRSNKQIPADEVPTLRQLLEALVNRVATLLPGKYNTAEDVWSTLGEEERSSFQTAVEQTALTSVHRYSIEAAPKGWPGRWIGSQTFSYIPLPVIPYLELASILHIGRQTHFGCGTFMID